MILLEPLERKINEHGLLAPLDEEEDYDEDDDLFSEDSEEDEETEEDLDD